MSLSLTYFTKHDTLQVHACCCKWQNFILFLMFVPFLFLIVTRELRDSLRTLEERVTSLLSLEAFGRVWKGRLSPQEAGCRLPLASHLLPRLVCGSSRMAAISRRELALSPPSAPRTAAGFSLLNVWWWPGVGLLLEFWGVEGMGEVKLST